MVKSKFKFNLDKIFIAILLVVMLVPFPTIIGPIRVVGVVLTPQRVVIPILFIYSIYKRLKSKNYFSNITKQWYVLSVVWIVTGVVLMKISHYIDLNSALKEMLTVVISFMACFVLINLITDKDKFDFSIKIIKVTLVISILFAIIEIDVGHHLKTSYFTMINAGPHLKGSTFTYFGTNDFCSYIALLLPVFFYQNKTTLTKIMSTVIIVLGLYLFLLNDARLCFISLFIETTIFVFYKSKIKKKQLTRIVIVFFILGVLVLAFIYIKRKMFYNLIFKFDNFFTRYFQNLIYKYQIHVSSEFLRSTIYKDTIKACIKNKLIGYGPDSFFVYFGRYPSISKLRDPHGFFFEILFNYGIIVLIFFIALIIKIYKQLNNIYNETHSTRVLSIMTMIIVYIVVQFSPSSYINYLYQWVPFMLGICMINYHNRIKQI